MSFLHTRRMIAARTHGDVIIDEFEVLEIFGANRGVVYVGSINFPPEFVGKRVRLRVEVVD